MGTCFENCLRQHDHLRQFYPPVDLNKLQEAVNSSLTFIVVRWDKSRNQQILNFFVKK